MQNIIERMAIIRTRSWGDILSQHIPIDQP